MPIAYQLFYLLFIDGESLLNQPLEVRKVRLREVLREHPMVRQTSKDAQDSPGMVACAPLLRDRHVLGLLILTTDVPGGEVKAGSRFRAMSAAIDFADIASGRLDPLAGRLLHVLDDVDELLERGAEIEADDLYALRLRRIHADT